MRTNTPIHRAIGSNAAFHNTKTNNVGYESQHPFSSFICVAV